MFQKRWDIWKNSNGFNFSWFLYAQQKIGRNGSSIKRTLLKQRKSKNLNSRYMWWTSERDKKLSQYLMVLRAMGTIVSYSYLNYKKSKKFAFCLSQPFFRRIYTRTFFKKVEPEPNDFRYYSILQELILHSQTEKIKPLMT